MKNFCSITALWFLLCLHPVALRAQARASLLPTELRVSGSIGPIGLDVQSPFFGWQLRDVTPAQRNVSQSAYRILVSSSAALLNKDQGDVWDSGKTSARTYNHISYTGATLRSHTTYFWKVCVWDGKDRQSGWSDPARWITALLHPEDWTAKWIAAQPDGPLEPQAREGGGAKNTKPETMPLFRHGFAVSKPVRQAVVYVSGLGQYELHLNGQPITDAVMTPGWTNYRRTVLYDTYDVTKQLKPGQNMLGVMLGNGMYNVPGLAGRYTKFIGSFGNPKLILQMHITFADDTEQVIASDHIWQTAPGPIVLSSIYGGEDYDARKELTAWDISASNTGTWSGAVEVAAPDGSKAPGSSMRSLTIPPMKVMQVLKPVHEVELRTGTRVYDLGGNFSGWPEIQVRGRAGDVVRMLPGELLNAEGGVTQRSAAASEKNPVLFTYTLRGDGVESWHPRFAYYGFRYVQVDAIPAQPGDALPSVVSLVGDFVHDDAEVDGEFHSSAPLLNDIHHLIDQAILSNMASVLTDCPTREKLGWLEQTYLNGGSIMYNYGVSQLYDKIADDMAEAQVANGMAPGIAPEYVAFLDKNGVSTAFRDSPEWGSAIILSPWAAYQFYGDAAMLAAHYDAMTRYAAYLKSRTVDGLLSYGLGDWYDIGPKSPGQSQLTGKGLTATAIYYQDLDTLRQIATVLHKPDEAAKFAREAQEVKTAFNRALYHPDTHTYDRGSQTAEAMPLLLGLAPAADRAAVLANLIADIRAHENHVTAGDVGFHYVIGALAQSGRSDVLYDMVTRTDSPSYGYQLSKGATSLTEAWDTNPASSQNHFMLGHAEEWFYRGLAGIDLDLSRGADEQIRLRPAVDSGAPGAFATVKTVLGTVSSAWQRSGQNWSAEFVIPAGTRATVILPMGAASHDTRAAGRSVEATETLGGVHPGESWILGSGTYRFTGRFQGQP